MPNRQRFRSHSRDSRSSRPYPSQRPYQAVTPVTPPPASTEKPKSSTKVVDMSGGFDCRICLDSFENIRKDAKSVRQRVKNFGLKISDYGCTLWARFLRALYSNCAPRPSEMSNLRKTSFSVPTSTAFSLKDLSLRFLRSI